MKRTEIYRLPPKLELKGAEEERILRKEVNDFLRKNYIDLETINPMKYLHEENGSLMLIEYGEDDCHHKAVRIQITSKHVETPKELSDLLVSKGFVRVQK